MSKSLTEDELKEFSKCGDLRPCSECDLDECQYHPKNEKK